MDTNSVWAVTQPCEEYENDYHILAEYPTRELAEQAASIGGGIVEEIAIQNEMPRVVERYLYQPWGKRETTTQVIWPGSDYDETTQVHIDRYGSISIDAPSHEERETALERAQAKIEDDKRNRERTELLRQKRELEKRLASLRA